MDIEHLIDRLEELFNDSPALPFTNNVIVNEDRMLDLIDQMRVHIPEEVKQARQVLTQKDRILAQAQEKANRIIAAAREEAARLVDKEAIVAAARKQADSIRAQAEQEAQATREDADAYVLETLNYLEGELKRFIKQVQDGKFYLQQQKEAPSEPPRE